MRNTKAYQSLPYNPALRDKAKALRKAGILHEALLWLELKNKQLNGLDFDRQKIIGNYIVDFYCAEKSTVIEVDGSSHDSKQLEDAQRDEYLKNLGLTVIRLLAKDVLQNIEGVVAFLSNHPTLTGTPPEEGNRSNIKTPTNSHALTGTPPVEGNRSNIKTPTNSPTLTGTPPEEGNRSNIKTLTNSHALTGTPPEEGNSSNIKTPTNSRALTGVPPKEGNKSPHFKEEPDA